VQLHQFPDRVHVTKENRQTKEFENVVQKNQPALCRRRDGHNLWGGWDTRGSGRTAREGRLVKEGNVE
jgi:hypothetical protein